MQDSTANLLDKGGDYILGMGVVALLVCVAVFVLLVLAKRRANPSFKVGALFLEAGAVAMIIAAALLYSKQLSVSWSFVIFIASSFLAFLGEWCLLARATCIESLRFLTGSCLHCQARW